MPPVTAPLRGLLQLQSTLKRGGVTMISAFRNPGLPAGEAVILNELLGFCDCISAGRVTLIDGVD